MKKSNWADNWQVNVRVWVESSGEAVLGEGRAELMAAVESERSITRAAKALGMSYRRAWTLIREINEAAGETLVEAAVGGKQGGGARLTPHGRAALDIYEKVRQSIVNAAAGSLHRSVAGDDGSSQYIHVAAAISTQEAVGQILAEYALVEPSVRVRVIFGASNELADHILAGAPGDIFLSAESSELDRLEAAHLLVPGSRRVIAQNGLAIVGATRCREIRKPRDLLLRRFRRVALAESACPLGHYSKTWLEREGFYDQLLPKVLHVDNSRAVLAAVVSGAAAAGVSFSSDAVSSGDWRLLLRVPVNRAAATYEAAIVDRGRGKHPGTDSLCDFLSSASASRAFRRCGLRPATIAGTQLPERRKRADDVDAR
jgi:molybdenum ABC transporter molybdate-binding protein